MDMAKNMWFLIANILMLQPAASRAMHHELGREDIWRLANGTALASWLNLDLAKTAKTPRWPSSWVVRAACLAKAATTSFPLRTVAVAAWLPLH
jgi:hypothetical protein